MKLLSMKQVEQIVFLIRNEKENGSISISKTGSAIPIYTVTLKNAVTLFNLSCTQLDFYPDGCPSTVHKNVHFSINGGWNASDRYTMNPVDIERLNNVLFCNS